MPRNGSGSYSLPQSPFVAGTVISSAAVNSDFSDIAAALTASLARDGQGAMTGVLPMATAGFHYSTDTNSGMHSTGVGTQAIFCASTDIIALAATGATITGILDVEGSFTVNGLSLFPIPTADIADAAVTYAKIQNVGASRIFGNPTGAPAVGSEISLGAGMSFVGTSIVSTINPALLPGYISGLILSTAGGSATFGISAGSANDTNSGGIMVLASAYTKTTSPWVVGTGNGSFDTNSAVSNNTWYHVYEIERPDTSVVDVCFSASAAAPTIGGQIPAAYTLARRIGSMKTDSGGHWLAFTQNYDTFTWVAMVQSTPTAGSASRNAVVLNVPTGVVVNALFRAAFTANGSIIFTALTENDVANTSSLADMVVTTGLSVAGQAAGDYARLTDTSAQIGMRGNNPVINVYGWVDSRGK